MLEIYLIVAGIVAVMDMINLGVVKPSRILGSLLWPISIPVLLFILVTTRGRMNND